MVKAVIESTLPVLEGFVVTFSSANLHWTKLSNTGINRADGVKSVTSSENQSEALHDNRVMFCSKDCSPSKGIPLQQSRTHEWHRILKIEKRQSWFVRTCYTCNFNYRGGSITAKINDRHGACWCHQLSTSWSCATCDIAANFGDTCAHHLLDDKGMAYIGEFAPNHWQAPH